MAVIGLDLGATKLAAALFDRDGSIIERGGGGLLADRGGDEVGRLIVEQVAALRTRGGGAGDENRKPSARRCQGLRITRPERCGRRTSPGGSGIRCATCSLQKSAPRARWSWRATARRQSLGRCCAALRRGVGTRSSWP